MSFHEIEVRGFFRYLLTQAHMNIKCIVDQYDRKGRRFDSTDDAPDTSYYQWVVFVFAFHENFVKLITKIPSTKRRVKYSGSDLLPPVQAVDGAQVQPRSALTARVRSCSVRTPSSSDGRRN